MEPKITVDNTQLTNVNSQISSQILGKHHLEWWIFGQRHWAGCVLECSVNKFYRSVVIPSLLYGCTSWTLYWRHIKQREILDACSPLLGIHLQNHVSNLEGLGLCRVHQHWIPDYQISDEMGGTDNQNRCTSSIALQCIGVWEETLRLTNKRYKDSVKETQSNSDTQPK